MSYKNIQNGLVKLGYGKELGKYGVDGIEGNNSKKAVLKFQKDYNNKFNKKIKIDGIGRSETQRSINDWISKSGTKGTRNFNIREMRCKGSGTLLKGGMDTKLMTLLETLRYRLGNKPMVITSGYRSPVHNKNVGGAKNSQHLYGKACDIKVTGVKPYKVYNEAVKLFDGVGKYNTFTHVDTRGYKARF